MVTPINLTPQEFASAAAQIAHSPMLFAGLPNDDEKVAIEQHKKGGGQVVYFVNEAEKASHLLGEGESGVVWSDDGVVKKFLFENVHTWMGGKIGNNLNAPIGANVENMPRAQRLASLLLDVLNLWKFDQSSAVHLLKDNVPMRNMLRNHRWVEDGIYFKDLKGRGKGITTVLVAAGPSLDSQWEQLKRIRDTVPNVGFIVAGRSYKQAMKAGLNPEFVMEVEQFEWDDRLFLFAPEPPPTSVLVGPLTACPNLFHAWPNKGHVCMTWDHNYAKLMGAPDQEINNGESSIDGGNSILHHMFNFACWLESDTICLAGVDFAYPAGHKKTHAEGTFHQWTPMVWKHEHAYQQELKVPCTSGGEVMASPPYKNFCTFLEIAIKKASSRIPNFKVINFSPNGQKIEGTQYEDIAQWRLSPPPSSVPPSSPLASGPVAFSASLVSASTLTSTEPSASNSSPNEPTPSSQASSEAKT